ncbi:hypothetical protein KEJ19_05895 [Candidatus Bathyarchaeota archaeon]|nr:hypothetical protein [Candidatus Bathyarchaeota archaeon]
MVEQIVAAGEKAGREALAEAKRILEGGGVGFEPVTSPAIFLAPEEANGLTGRLLGAVWDDWRILSEGCRVGEVMEKGLFTLRRIDGVFFIPKDRNIPRR